LTGGDPWYYFVSMSSCVHFGLVSVYGLVILSIDIMLCIDAMNIVKFE
jgi:hypothetical protein